ncbi:MAG: Type IV pilus assembly protein PilM [Candidatus Moranbacteria bacterium GW2011_GWA2_39_41]|nr:MAG: Type IV pilus assembly protein PilM [Candidatus Moranbacteria bacterium GW2011_GWA2_39_41]
MSFLNKNIINFEPKIIGLDLSDLSVKVFQVEKDGGHDVVRGYGSVDIPLGNIDDGRIINESIVAEAIKSVLKLPSAKKINSNKVICSLPESKAFVRIITIPKMSEDEAKEAVKWEMEANMPMSLAEVYFDWQFLKVDSDGKKQHVLTVAVSREIVDSRMSVLTLAGLDAYSLEVESIASIRSLVNSEAVRGEISLIVDLGARRTSFIIADDVVPYFTSSIPFSSESMNDAISKTLNLSSADAEKVKVNNGIVNAGDGNPIFNAVSPLLENLVTEIMKTMDFYGEMSKRPKGVNKIILCGGGSSMKGLAEYLQQRTKKDVSVGSPWINLKTVDKLPTINKETSVRYVTAIGLAIRGMNYGN